MLSAAGLENETSFSYLKWDINGVLVSYLLRITLPSSLGDSLHMHFSKDSLTAQPPPQLSLAPLNLLSESRVQRQPRPSYILSPPPSPASALQFQLFDDIVLV